MKSVSQSARLIAAFAAAVGLHLLGWQLLQPHQMMQPGNSHADPELRVELLQNIAAQKQLPEAKQIVKSGTIEPAPVKQQTPKPKRAEVVAVAAPTIAPAAATLDSDHSQQKKTVSEAKSPTKIRPAQMPASAVQIVMAHVRYPRLAQRKGWQGRATFNVDVKSQKLIRLALASSSGHRVLDSAAMRGIRDVDHLPLSDGSYWLPVEFRLQ